MKSQQPKPSRWEALASVVTDHKDRLLKASQYVALFVSWYYQSRSFKEQEEHYYQMYKNIFNARRMYRLGHWLVFVRAIQQSRAELLKGMSLERFSALVINVSRFLFFLLDNLSIILKRINYPRFWYLKARRTSFTFLLLALVFSLVLYTRKLRANF